MLQCKIFWVHIDICWWNKWITATKVETEKERVSSHTQLFPLLTRIIFLFATQSQEEKCKKNHLKIMRMKFKYISLKEKLFSSQFNLVKKKETSKLARIRKHRFACQLTLGTPVSEFPFIQSLFRRHPGQVYNSGTEKSALGNPESLLRIL